MMFQISLVSLYGFIS